MRQSTCGTGVYVYYSATKLEEKPHIPYMSIITLKVIKDFIRTLKHHSYVPCCTTISWIERIGRCLKQSRQRIPQLSSLS